jgi:hypothetical protein
MDYLSDKGILGVIASDYHHNDNFCEVFFWFILRFFPLIL